MASRRSSGRVHPPRVGVLGFFGIRNLGNEATLDVALDLIQAHVPEARVLCIAPGPDIVAAQRGLPAVRMQSVVTSRGGLADHRGAKVMSRLRDIPHTFRVVRSIDVLVVAGCGILEVSLQPNPFGLPYWMFLYCTVARLARRRVILLAVGAERPRRWGLRRFLMWGTSRSAHWASYRDARSLDVVRDLGPLPPRGTVVPDLVFARPVPAGSSSAEARRVVMSVMQFHWGAGADRANDVQVSVVRRLIAEGWTVTLIIGDLGDEGFAAEILESATSGLSTQDGRVQVTRVLNYDEVIGVMRGASVAVVTRFHHLVAALQLAKPTVGLHYAQKGFDLMDRVGLRGLSQWIEDADVDLLMDQLSRAEADKDAYAEGIQEHLDRFRGQLEVEARTLAREIRRGS